MSLPQVSLIVTTYNRPEALELCLQSILRQKQLPDEVVIGDDGSAEETALLIRRYRAMFPVPLKHIWQPDEGFRLSMIRNRAVAASRGEYIIEIDGDLILHPAFIRDHLNMARRGCFLKGGRCNLTRKRTRTLTRKQTIPPLCFLSPGLRRRLNALHLPALGRWLAPHYKQHATTGLGLGCNMSFWRSDFLRINGYDEFFTGWGSEDNDFASRLLNAGVSRLRLKFSAIVYHLWHTDHHMYNRRKNQLYYQQQRACHSHWAPQGVDRYL